MEDKSKLTKFIRDNFNQEEEKVMVFDILSN